VGEAVKHIPTQLAAAEGIHPWDREICKT